MTRLVDIEAHIESMAELSGIVGAMRSLAGMRVQEAERALPGIRRYAEAMAVAVATAMTLMPEAARGAGVTDGRRAIVLFAAEHGFVGGLNERLIGALDAVVGPQDTLFMLGSRGAGIALGRGRRAAWTQAMATRTASVSEAVGRLTSELYRRIARGEIARVEVMYARYRRGGGPTVERHAVLPLDPAALKESRPRFPPLHTLSPAKLLECLMAEYVQALLTEAAVESLASENAARFAAMQAARENVAKKLDRLRVDARQARQDEITTELLDLIAGVQALDVG
ncbi:MAG: F0F1 ATP synthase subunit gamma [Alphaproteobacteria bacterium]